MLTLALKTASRSSINYKEYQTSNYSLFFFCFFVVLESDMSSPFTGPAEPVYVEEKMYLKYISYLSSICHICIAKF